MKDNESLHSRICDEMDKIAEKGLSNSNFETAYKLVDMHKDLAYADYCHEKAEYYADLREQLHSDDGEGAHVLAEHGAKNGSDTFNRYMEAKQAFRNLKNSECKQRLIDMVVIHMDTLTRQLEDMLRDSDCAEERATIRRYLESFKRLA